MHNRVPLSYSTQKVNGTLLNTHDSIYRRSPSPEVDAAWERLANIDATFISGADVLALGKDVSKVAKYPDDFGLGPDAYVAELDVMHLIHCLNALRRDVYFSHYFGSKYPDGQPSELHRVHSDHCIYVLLQNLMCNANVDVITLDWVEGQKHPFPDFSINHKCINFDSILQWQEEHAVDRTKFLAIQKPDDHTPMRMSDDFKRMFGVDGDSWRHEHTH
jgi:Mycotoxin biosynthesis protein UstYa